MCDIKYQDLIRILRKDWTDECLIFLKSSSSGELNDMTLKKYADKIINKYNFFNKSVSRPNFQEKLDVFMETKYVFPKTVP